MSFNDIIAQQRDGLRAASSVGVIGLHLVSGPLVGFGIGYGLDTWLDATPWFGLGFLLVGIGAGFLNVWRDSKAYLRRLAREDAQAGGRDA